MNRLASLDSSERRIGLLAGWGDFPLAVARTLKRQGYAVFCQGIRDHADPRLGQICDSFRYVGIAKMGGQIRYFKQKQVKYATMAGKIFKAKLLYHRWSWFHNFPDWQCCRAFYPHFIAKTADRRDDTLLVATVDLYASHGIEFAPATNFAPELLVKLGTLSGRKPNHTQMKDIRFGWELAKELGRLDTGQTVVVKGLCPVAIEAVEGTDECIRRAGKLCAQGGFTVVKVAKPQQDMRFDVPTIGLGTLETLVEAGGKVLAVEAGKTIIVEQEKVIRFAQRHGVTLVAVDAQQMRERNQAA